MKRILLGQGYFRTGCLFASILYLTPPDHRDTSWVYRESAFHTARDRRRQAEGSELFALRTREAMASASDERENGATSQHPCSPSFRLSALVRDSQVSLNFNKEDLFENPSGCQRNSPFPHHRSTPGKLQKESKYHWLPHRGGGGSSVVVGLLRSGRKGQKKRASLSSNRDINKDLLAARNLALKPCKTTWSKRAYCLLGYKSIELDLSRRPLCSLQRSTVPETQSSASAFPVWKMGIMQ